MGQDLKARASGDLAGQDAMFKLSLLEF